MKRDTIDEILQQKLHDLESVDVPGWESFENRINGKSRRLQITRYTTIAAAIALFFGLGYFMIDSSVNKPTEIDQAPAAVSSNKSVSTLATDSSVVSLAKQIETFTAKNTLADLVSYQQLNTVEIINSTEGDVINSINADSELPTKSQPEKEQPALQGKSIDNPQRTPDFFPSETGNNRSTPKIAIAVHSNAVGFNRTNSQQTVQRANFAHATVDNLGGNKTQIDMKGGKLDHKFPIAVGLNLSMEVARRLSIESGLSYTYMESTLDQKSSYNTKYEQQLQYLGVPINVSYSFLQTRVIDLYLTAGVMGQFAIATSSNTNVYQNNVLKTSTHNRPSAKGLLMSLNAAVGANINITPRVGFYLEPGASQYFNNGNHPESYYNRNLAMFNLKAGIRVKL